MTLAHETRHNILGILVTATDLGGAVARIKSWIVQSAREYVCVTDAHCIIRARDEADLQPVYAGAGMVTTDGMPLVWMCQAAGHRHARRVYGPDLMLAAFADPELRGRRHFFFGGADGVASDLATKLTQQFSGLNVAGTYTPPFGAQSADDVAAMVTTINAAKADVVWVCLGAPKQERWMASFRAQLDAPVLVGVGAAFDFLSGAKPQAPAFMRRNGLEWVFRLASEPRRLGPRYLKTVPRFALLAVLQISGLRRFPLLAP